MPVSTVSPHLPSFIGGAPCLDFANTVDPRHAKPRDDFLRDYRRLAEWSERARLLSTRQARELRQRAQAEPAAADAVLIRAVELREAVYTLLAPQPPSVSERTRRHSIKTLNDEVHRAQAMADLKTSGTDWRWQWCSGPILDRMVWPIARSAAELLLSKQLRRIRECEGANGCGWLFLDTSKNGRRRWCDMSVCGNRAKARRHRQRQGPVS
jgi:predicted RNA-binding Zn ribbon-like protein